MAEKEGSKGGEVGTSRSFKPSRTEHFHCAQISIPRPWEKALLGQLLVCFRKNVSFLQEPVTKAAGLLAEREQEGKEDTQ